nr:baseplate J/gp47 family protein [uncultured Cellulosilyticum sp.]
MGLNSLREITFCNTDTKDIENDVITAYEGIAGRKLYPGDPIRLFLEALAYIITQQRFLIDFTGKQNLLAYATGDYLDQVVALVGVTRLAASPARCTVKFSLSDAQQSAVTIPKGTRLKSGELYFKTLTHEEVLPGQLQLETIVECETPGECGNGLLPGQIETLVDVFPYFGSVTNITTTAGGSDIETDDALRKRAFEAPSSYSCAGSDGAYAFWAKSVSPEIGDVAVISPQPGEVNIIPISKEGQLLSEEILEKILQACSEKHVKPLTDKVVVMQPEQVSYNIALEYYIDSAHITQVAAIQKNIEAAITDYIVWQQSQLGRAINPSELIHQVMAAGAKRVVVHEPIYTPLEKSQIPQINKQNVIYGGYENG